MHTPGPWTVDIRKDGGDWYYIIRGVSEHEYMLGKQVAEANRYLLNADDNARLIAAAPDLLAALVEAIEHIPEDANEATEAAVARARAAIAKAKGE